MQASDPAFFSVGVAATPVFSAMQDADQGTVQTVFAGS